MMDWYVIDYLYPNALKKFIDTMFPNIGMPSISTLEFYDIKRLYNFFDKNGVYLYVEMYSKDQWVFTISLNNGVVFGPTQNSKKTREDAECDGFSECFKLMEKIILDKI
jgi:hypothetical protein